MKRTAEELMKRLNREEIKTWFDLGLFLDRLKESNPVPTAEFNGKYEKFKEKSVREVSALLRLVILLTA